MKFVFIAYLVIAFVFGFLDTYGMLTLGDDSAVTICYGSDGAIACNDQGTLVTSEFTSHATDFANAGTLEQVTGFAGIVTSTFSTIIKMMSFNFSINGAPEVVNAFLAGIIAIMSTLLWLDLIGRIVSVLPFIG